MPASSPPSGLPQRGIPFPAPRSSPHSLSAGAHCPPGWLEEALPLVDRVTKYCYGDKVGGSNAGVSLTAEVIHQDAEPAEFWPLVHYICGSGVQVMVCACTRSRREVLERLYTVGGRGDTPWTPPSRPK